MGTLEIEYILETLREAEDYFSNRQDANFDNGYIPNEEMKMVEKLDLAIKYAVREKLKLKESDPSLSASAGETDEVDRILAMNDDELDAEIIKRGLDPVELEAVGRRGIARGLQECAPIVALSVAPEGETL